MTLKGKCPPFIFDAMKDVEDTRHYFFKIKEKPDKNQITQIAKATSNAYIKVSGLKIIH